MSSEDKTRTSEGIEQARALAHQKHLFAQGHALDALKSLVLINGGAVVALLTLVGALKEGSLVSLSLPLLISGLRFYCIGLLCAILASIALWFGFNTSGTYGLASAERGEPPSRKGRVEALAAAFCLIGSVAFFWIGTSTVTKGFAARGPTIQQSSDEATAQARR